MALYLCHNNDCTNVVSNTLPISTKHTNQGEPQEIGVYIFNDGMRTGVENDTSGMDLIYTNIQLMVVGVDHVLQSALSPSTSTVSLILDSTEGWGIGTIIKAGLERMRVEEIISETGCRVTRNYTADGGVSSISSHTVGESLVPETSTVSLAPVSAEDDSVTGTYLNGGETMQMFLDPSYLNAAVVQSEAANKISSTNGSRYSVNSIIQIDNEQMKVTEVNGNNLTVIRGYNNTARMSHQQRAMIYTVGLVDINVAHKFYIKNDPPAGLPTQKKADIKIVISADEEPL